MSDTPRTDKPWQEMAERLRTESDRHLGRATVDDKFITVQIMLLVSADCIEAQAKRIEELERELAEKIAYYEAENAHIVTLTEQRDAAERQSLNLLAECVKKDRLSVEHVELETELLKTTARLIDRAESAERRAEELIERCAQACIDMPQQGGSTYTYWPCVKAIRALKEPS